MVAFTVGFGIQVVYVGFQETKIGEKFSIPDFPVLTEWVALTYRAGHHSTSDDSTRYRQLSHVIQVAEKVEKPPLGDIFTDVYNVLPSNLSEQEMLLRKTIKRHPMDYPCNFCDHKAEAFASRDSLTAFSRAGINFLLKAKAQGTGPGTGLEGQIHVALPLPASKGHKRADSKAYPHCFNTNIQMAYDKNNATSENDSKGSSLFKTKLTRTCEPENYKQAIKQTGKSNFLLTPEVRKVYYQMPQRRKKAVLQKLFTTTKQLKMCPNRVYATNYLIMSASMRVTWKRSLFKPLYRCSLAPLRLNTDWDHCERSGAGHNTKHTKAELYFLDFGEKGGLSSRGFLDLGDEDEALPLDFLFFLNLEPSPDKFSKPGRLVK
ncbi:hypothetical protein RJ640_008231 [Escallonia rubra]|uniref:Uncharacterized protein n=1 Tax=Escallonia rubra TaxID=112253 RepID=A0AA88QGX3_9ASTE|nr:hypothetical protein RJ640_008231 [Escallonia rubra]